MCLKPRVKDIERYDFLEKILEDSRRKITELEETEEKEMLFAYELLKAKQSLFFKSNKSPKGLYSYTLQINIHFKVSVSAKDFAISEALAC